MNLSVESMNDQQINIIRLKSERLDTSLAPDLKAKLIDLLNASEKGVLIDLEKVEYADSSGLGAILFGVRMARDISKACKLVNLNSRVLSLIKIAKLDHVIEAFEEEDEAVASFA